MTVKNTPDRKKAAALARELRKVSTPSLTVREKNRAVRSHAHHVLKTKAVWE